MRRLATLCTILLLAGTLAYADDTKLELTIAGNVLINAADPDQYDSGGGQALAFGADFPLGRGIISANVELQRADGFDVNGVGAYNVDAMFRLNARPGKQFNPYIGGGFGASWLDRLQGEVEIDETTYLIDRRANFVRYDLEGGFTWEWGATGFGMVGKYRLTQPVDQALDMSTAEWAIGLRMPTPPLVK